MHKFSLRGKRPVKSRLHKLLFGGENSQSATLSPVPLYILFVPDLCTKEPETSLRSSWALLRRSIPADTRALAFGFEYHISAKSSDKSVWEATVDKAKELVECLIEQFRDISFDGASLVFFCHGLGGILAKEALANIYDPRQLDSQQQRIRNFHQGTVLIGTPHPTNERPDKWPQLILALRSAPTCKFAHLDYPLAELDTVRVVSISKKFQERVRDTPAVSIYEAQPTKVQRSLWSSSKHILVDRVIAEIGTPGETLVELSTDHFGLLSCPNNEEMLRAIAEVIRNALGWAIPQRNSSLSSSNDTSGESINDVLTDDTDQADEAQEDHSEDDGYVNLGNRSRAEITTLSELSHGPKSLVVPFTTLKPSERNAQFFGRQDMLTLIENALLPTNESAQTRRQDSCREFAICGLGGMGKTELAREFAFSREGHFDAVFWIEAEQDTQLSEGFAAIASQLGHTDTDKDRVVARHIALEWLNNPVKRPSSKLHLGGGHHDSGSGDSSLKEDSELATWLLIFNNADDLALLKDFWPASRKGSVLLTSRDPVARHGRSGINLEPLPLEDAAILLRRLSEADSPKDLQASLDIAERLGGLPLAVTQIAAYIARFEMTLPEFLVFFDKQPSIERVAKDKHTELQLREHYRHSLFTVWAFERLSAQSGALLEVLSFLNPDLISESLFGTIFTNSSGSKVPLVDGFPSTYDEYLEARVDLTRVSLVRRNKGEAKLSLHRLVQDVVRSQMTRTRTVEILELTALLVLQAWPTGFLRFDHDTATWDASEELLPHILKLKQFFQQHSEDIESGDAKRNLARLLLFAGWYLLERSDFEAAMPLLLHVLELSDRNKNLEMREIRADALFSLSALSAQINEDINKNLQYARDHFDLRVKLRDGTSFGEARVSMAHGMLAHIHMLAGQYEDAVHHSQVAIDMTEETEAYRNGTDFPTFATSHLAFSLAALGQCDKAMSRLDLALEYWNTHPSKAHSHQLGIVYRCIGFVKKQQGLADDSFSAYLKAMGHFKDAMGDKTHYVAHMCSNLAAYHIARREYETASIYVEKAVSGYLAHTCYKPQLALALFRRGNLLAAMGDAEGAKVSFSQSKKLYAAIEKGGRDLEDDFELTEEMLLAAVPISSR